MHMTPIVTRGALIHLFLLVTPVLVLLGAPLVICIRAGGLTDEQKKI